ncbi:DUF3105 domain-containing protein [Modestobacter sp. I12A-02628]|uniref:DUF3105 domain-containing protein n=1 Tax=Goekera deserti TaxID=2497753 RepID=A0A7K3WDG7_9ACTN|nr:DUF3105 domain-containing protein [Goekera deserti]MPQ97138.1 DUF3105 domain-containing protein [Goekera deserti]NDI46544.1 DUF3105 domain-containing protein [Goekera deserti]NEL54522.1 DUF3105 domain-containing protein [Goekera deserti]
MTSSGGRRTAAGRGRRTAPTQVVAPSRPWGLIAAAVVVALFAVAVVGYAVVRSNRAEAESVTSPDQIPGVAVYEYPGGAHTADPVGYEQTPPVGGEHDLEWADCTGSVYPAPIRDENAVHALEHGAVWITYDPDVVTGDDLAVLVELTDGVSGTMVSPYPGQDTPVSLQSWGHQLRVDAVGDPRVEQFLQLLRYAPGLSPEPGASCENPQFLDAPLRPEDPSRTG